MYIYYCFVFFIFGTVLGSFFNVVGYRLPRNESIVYPPSHCPNCNHRLKMGELIPIFSYLIQGGKCKNCHKHISLYYPIFEALCGLAFLLAYISYGLTLEVIIPLTFISMLIIIMVSDYYYMIIPDEVLIFFGILLLIEQILINGISVVPLNLLNALIAFGLMFLLKIFGDFIFKKESMGGGDIKLLGLFGLVLGWPNSLFAIILGSVIGLPISLIVLMFKKSHIIPFGPFLALGAMTIVLFKLDIINIINLLTI